MLEKYTFDGKKKVDIKSLPTGADEDQVEEEKIVKKYHENIERMIDYQEKLYAEKKEGLIIIFQALDAAGKDSSIKHVITALNPQGVHVSSFKPPSEEELSHDYLRRIHAQVPPRGEIAVFNRSHYEDLVTVRVHPIRKSYRQADRIMGVGEEEFFERRYGEVRAFEAYLYNNSYRFVKIFLNVSKKTQLERLLERIDKKEKHRKFDPSDVRDRKLFDRYLEVYNEAINETASPENPRYVLPADQKRYTRYLISEAILKTLEEMDPSFPLLSEEEEKALEAYKKDLLGIN